MSNEKNDLSRRRALKVLAIGMGTAGTLPVLNNPTLGQSGHEHHHHHAAQNAAGTTKAKHTLKFFTPVEIQTVATISDLIIPTDDHSPGAKAAEVHNFIDLMVSEASQETKTLWRDGLLAVDKLSKTRFKKEFNSATQDQQIQLLTEMSRNEFAPKTVEEKFFQAIKNLTIDGYYTSEIGIHKDLQYKGNSYAKEFKGCTHPEHQA
jgi:hypothetical protein